MGPYKQKGTDFGAGTGSNPESKPSRKEVRQARRSAKKDAIASMPGTTGLERRLNYKGTKARARKANKAAVKKAKSITPEQRKANQTKATSDHNKRVADATAKYGKKDAPKPKPKAKVETARGTGTTYDMAWEKNKNTKAYAKYKGNKAAAIADMKAWNKKQDAKKRAAGGNAATKHSLTKDKGTKGGKPGAGYMGR